MTKDTDSPFVNFRTIDITDLRHPGAKGYKFAQNATDFDQSLGNTIVVGGMSKGMTTAMNHELMEQIAGNCEGRNLLEVAEEIEKAAKDGDTES